jgi:hypothetical protein
MSLTRALASTPVIVFMAETGSPGTDGSRKLTQPGALF